MSSHDNHGFRQHAAAITRRQNESTRDENRIEHHTDRVVVHVEIGPARPQGHKPASYSCDLDRGYPSHHGRYLQESSLLDRFCPQIYYRSQTESKSHHRLDGRILGSLSNSLCPQISFVVTNRINRLQMTGHETSAFELQKIAKDPSKRLCTNHFGD